MHYSPDKRFASALELQEELSVAAAELDTEESIATDARPQPRVPSAPTSQSSLSGSTRAPSPASTSIGLLIAAIVLSAIVGAMTASVLLRTRTPTTGQDESEPAPTSPNHETRQRAQSFEPPRLPEDIAAQLSACIASDVPSETHLELRLDAAGQLVSIDAADELDALTLHCIRRALAEVPLSRSGVAETHRVPLSQLIDNGGTHAP
jgi:hypothetical protein